MPEPVRAQHRPSLLGWAVLTGALVFQSGALTGSVRADERAAAPRAPAAQPIVFQIRPGGNVPGNRQDKSSEADEPDSESPARNAGLVLADRIAIVRLSRARKALQEGEYAEAIHGLQSLVDSPEDGAFHIDEAEKSGLRSIKLEAERLIGAMPPEGRRIYEAEFGPQARRMLQEAKEPGDARLLAEVSRRFFHTQAGYEAAYLLAASHLDHGQPLTAALGFERLRGAHRGGRRAPPQGWSGGPAFAGARRRMLCLKTAMAWLMAGMPQQSVDALDELYELDPTFTVRLGGGRKTSLFGDEGASGGAGLTKAHGLRAPPAGWSEGFGGSLRRLASLIDWSPRTEPPGLGHWSMFRGNPSRTAVSSGGPPTMDVRWEASTSSWTVPEEEAPFFGGVVDVGLQIAELELDYQQRDQAAIPGVNPVVVGSVVLARTVDKLQAFDLETGTPLWEAQQDDALEQLRSGKVPSLPGDRGSLLDPLLLQRVFTDATYGTLSADAARVFGVTGLGYSGSADELSRRGRNQSPHPLARKTYNRLEAYKISTGELAWRVGGPRESDQGAKTNQSDGAAAAADVAAVEGGAVSRTLGVSGTLGGHFFLGPPLTLAGRLYALSEEGGQIRLVVLDAATGRLDWSQSLHSPAYDVTQDVRRGRSGLSPSYAGGILVCPTGAGVVVAVDAATRSLMWSYRYREPEEENPRNRLRALALARLAAQRGDPTPNSPVGQWKDALPILVAGRVILTPPGSDELHCLNLTDGTLLWELSRDEGIFVGGVYDGKLLIVGSRQFELLRLEDGQPVWRVPTELPLPSGRGLLIGDRYYVPLSTAAIATLDLKSGRFVSLVESADGIVPGNLVSSGERIISQSAGRIVCFKQRPLPPAGSE